MENKQFAAAMYLRLSREDRGKEDKSGFGKLESDSIANQRELIWAYLGEQQDMELYDIYVDDGFSGSNFDRPGFKRMMGDIEAGRVNCVIVKDLSRFGRDYIESGRYIQKRFPQLGVRFIALTDRYDSFLADAGESGIVLPVKNFINDSYCRDISTKVKSQLEVKRKNGECVAPFALYGYRKSVSSKNRLVVDEYAAEIVRNIFEWKIEGLAISAIAGKLNDFGILSPKEYKKSIGCHYGGGFPSGAEKSLWSSSTIKRILTNEMYLGHLVQGKTEKINYKLKKSVKKPKKDWVKVEHTHEPIVSQHDFLIVQNLLKTDSRISPMTKKGNPFSGILFCGDCGEQMIRRVNRYKDSQKMYDICSTKNRGEGCTRHSIEEEKLKSLVSEVIQRYVNCFLEEKKVFQRTLELKAGFERAAVCYDVETERLKREQDKYDSLCLAVYQDWEHEILTREESERLHSSFKRKAEEWKEVWKKHAIVRENVLQRGIRSAERLKAMQNSCELKEIDRHTLCSMVKEIFVYEEQRVEIVFSCTDRYRTMGRG